MPLSWKLRPATPDSSFPRTPITGGALRSAPAVARPTVKFLRTTAELLRLSSTSRPTCSAASGA
jgi:hypothetical protein